MRGIRWIVLWKKQIEEWNETSLINSDITSHIYIQRGVYGN
jgi:hypothetical protein